MAKELAKYTADSGNDIVLTDDTVRNLISTDPNVTDKEVMAFAALCKAHRLDPFIKEAYLIKYGSQPATIVVGKDVFTKRAFRHPKYRGSEAGLFVITANGKGKERQGSMVLPGEQVVGGWAKVYLDGYQVPIYDSVSFEEYAGKKKDGSLNQQWRTKPGTMMRKVALVHALREAFPEDFQGLYDYTEMGISDPEQPELEKHARDIEAAVEEVFEGAEVYEEPCLYEPAPEELQYVEEAF